MSGDNQLESIVIKPSSYSVVDGVLSFRQTSSGADLSAPTQDTIGTFGNALSLMNYNNLYTNNQTVFLATHIRFTYLGNQGTSSSTTIPTMTSDLMKQSWANNLSIAFGLPGNDFHKILAPMNPLKANYAPNIPESAPSTASVVFAPKECDWYPIDPCLFGENQSQETISFVNTNNVTAYQSYPEFAACQVQLKGYVVTADSQTSKDTMVKMIRKLGFAYTPWSSDCLVKALNGLPCNCKCGRIQRLAIGGSSDWQSRAIQYALSESRFLSTELPDKVHFHRIMGVVRFPTGNVAKAAIGQGLYGTPVAGILESPNIYSAWTGQPSKFRFIAQYGVLTTRVANSEFGLSVHFANPPGSVQAIGVLDTDCQPQLGLKLPVWKSSNVAAVDDITVNQVSLHNIPRLRNYLYLGVNKSQERFYISTTNNAYDIPLNTDWNRLLLYGTVLEFASVTEAVAFDTVIQSIGILKSGNYLEPSPGMFE